MDYRVLGPMAVENGQGPVRLGGPRQQTVLAVLLCNVNLTVEQGALIDAVWSGQPPGSAKSTLQTYVYGLRQALGSEQIIRQGGGYRIELGEDDYDALRFERLVRRGRGELAADADRARTTLSDALGLWYGNPFGGLNDNPVVMGEAARLAELRLVANESRIEADLAAGDHAGVVAELRSLVRDHPLRERLRALQMLALYRSGRQAEALEVFQRARHLLQDELGLEPSAQLQALEQRMLTQDPRLLHADDRRTSPPRGPATNPQRPAPGRSLRGFELREPLGEGHVGTVFRAFQPSVGREVALKVIRAEHANRPAFVRHFEREAQVVAQLEHPHLVPLFDYWRDTAGAYLVMPLLRGGSLTESLRHGGPWSLPRVLDVLGQVGSALSHAHRHGVVHRAVKPGNVLLDEEGNAYLTDFGIAGRRAEKYADGPSVAELGHVPPEARRGAPLTAQSDVFGLGALTFHLLTGVAPPDHGALPAVTGLRPDLPNPLDGVLGRATHDDPRRRHDRVEAFLRDLRRSVGTDTAGVTTTVPRAAPDGDVRNPYKGLRAFRETDAADFHGRDALIDELLEAVATHTLVTVVGPSGSGKSSVVRAGLVPRLRAGGLPGSGDWLFTDMFPGSYPYEELEAALRRVATDEHVDLLAELTAPHGLLRASKRLVPDDGCLVLLVDQFEELFSGGTPAAVRRQFLDDLAEVAEDERSRLRVLLTLRADFFDRPLHSAEFTQVMTPGMVTIAPPSRDGLAQAIAAPARSVGVGLEPGLVSRIVADIEHQPGGLPLLQYALTELFATRADGEMTIDDYERIGGVAGALGRRAEELHTGMNDRQQEAVRNVFLRLVTVDETAADTRRRARLSELVALTGHQDTVDQVLHEFGSFRLLSFDRDPATRSPTVEVAHEALLREWPRLRRWVDERREDLAMTRRLAMAAEEWETADHDESFLLRGAHLVQVERWMDTTDVAPTDLERRFLRASLDQRDVDERADRHRRHRLVAGLVAALTVISVLGIAAVLQRGVARSEARDARVRELAGEAVLAAQEDPERGVLVALAATELSRSGGATPLPEAVGALHQTVQQLRLVDRIDTGGQMAFVGDGDDPTLILGDPDGTALLASGDAAPVLLAATDEEPSPVATSAAGLIAVGLGPGASTPGVNLYADDGTPHAALGGRPGHSYLSLDIADDGRTVAATSCALDDNLLCTSPPVLDTWDVDGAGRTAHDVGGHPWQVVFVDDRTVVVATIAPSAMSVLDLATDTSRTIDVDLDEVTALAVTPDGTHAAVTAPTEDRILVLDLEAGTTVTSIPSTSEFALAWAPDGRRLAATGFTGIVRVLDGSTGELELELRGADENLFDLAFTPSGEELLASTFDRTWRWDVRRSGPDELGAVPLHLGPPGVFAPSPDGTRITAYTTARGVEVIDAGSGRQLAALTDVEVGVDTGLNVPSRDGTVVGALTTDGRSTVRSLPDLAVVRDLRPCTNALAFSPGAELALVTGNVCPNGDGHGPERARVLRVRDDATVLELDHRWIYSADFRPGESRQSGRHLAITDQVVVELHDLATGDRVAAVTGADVGSPDAGSLVVSFDPDGRYLTTGMSDGRTWVVDVEELLRGTPFDEALVFNRVTHTGAAPRPVVTRDGVLATTGFDGLVRLWDVAEGHLLTEFTRDTSAGLPAIVWTHDDQVLLYNDGGVIRRFHRDVDELVALAEGLLTRELTPDECLRHLGTTDCSA